MGSTSTVVTYGSSLLDIANPKRELTVNYDANDQGGTISSLDPVKVTEDFLGWYDSSNVQVINNNGEFVKNASGYTDSNGNWIRMSDASLRAVWTGRKQVTLSTINKIGHTCSWNTNMNGIGTSYNSGEVIYLGEDRTLYAVCKANTYTITYDSNSGSGCSGTKTVTYGEPIGELCTPSKATNYMFVGWFDDSNALHDNSLSYKDHPWLYYADTYNDLYNAFGYDEDSLYTHYNENVTNGSENRRKSQYLASDTYNIAGNITLNAGWYKLWEGIPLGNYTLGQTVIYAGLEWTVVNDKGDNVGLARNNTFGQGDPADSGTILTQNYIPLNTVLTKDMNNGGLIDQGNGEYATTNSGISLGYSGFNYFTDQSHFYNTNTRNRLELVSGSYIRGGSSVRGGANLPIEYYDSSYKTVETIDPGIKSIASDDWTVDKVNSTVTFKDIAATYTTTSDYYSTVLTRFNMKSHSNCTPSSTTLCYTDSRFNVVNGAFEVSSSEALMGATARINVKVCGGTWNDKSIVYQYKDANSFYYGNEYTGTGWSSSGFNASYSMNYILNSQNIIANYAGGISINCSSGLNCTSTTVGSVNRYIRNYYLSDSDNCQQVRRYTLEDRTYDIYFRPYIIVRER